MQTRVDFSLHIKLGSCCTGLLLSSDHNGFSSGGKRAKLARLWARIIWLWARIMRLFAFAHSSPWRHPSLLSLLHGGHLIHGGYRIHWSKLNQTFTYFCILKLFQVPSKIIQFRSMNPPSYFPHLLVKPALINGGIYLGASYKFVCTKSFKELSTSDWEPVCSKRASCKANRRGDPGSGQSGCD